MIGRHYKGFLKRVVRQAHHERIKWSNYISFLADPSFDKLRTNGVMPRTNGVRLRTSRVRLRTKGAMMIDSPYHAAVLPGWPGAP